MAIQQENVPAITSPEPGQALQGVVTVTGVSAVDSFQSAEIAFTYSNDPTGTWFLIQSSNQPEAGGILAIWDTTALTDNVYTLRLRVTRTDGNFVDAKVIDLRVRNYTPVETATSPALQPPEYSHVQPIETPKLSPSPEPTSLAPNPAAFTPHDIFTSMGIGALVIVLIFAIFGIILRLRRH